MPLQLVRANDMVRLDRSPPRVVALHASASSSKQWRALARRLAGITMFSSPDHFGHGACEIRSERGEPSLAEHVARLASHVDADRAAVHLIGHSFGGVVALQYAIDNPWRVRSLVLYEPVLLSVLAGRVDLTPGERAVNSIADQVRHALNDDMPIQAAETFVSYWGGNDAWRGLDARQQAAVARQMTAVAGHFDVIQGAHELADRLPELAVPTLLLTGARSTPSAKRVADLIGSSVRQARRVVIEGAGHMGPISHAAEVNEQIAEFILAKR